MYLVAPLHIELAEVGEERIRQVSLALADLPGADDWPGLGLGFREDGLERPAAIILHAEGTDSTRTAEIAAAITRAAADHLGVAVPTVTQMSDDSYERLALEQAVVVPREHFDADAAAELEEGS